MPGLRIIQLLPGHAPIEDVVVADQDRLRRAGDSPTAPARRRLLVVADWHTIEAANPLPHRRSERPCDHPLPAVAALHSPGRGIAIITHELRGRGPLPSRVPGRWVIKQRGALYIRLQVTHPGVRYLQVAIAFPPERRRKQIIVVVTVE